MVISGLAVTNADFEGILVSNATGITITNNQVTSNDRSLNRNDGTCPGLPEFETNENDDCGEGIHLIGVSHSIVSGNIVKNNAGRILISDERGPSHDNLNMGNTVSDNPYECGITMASHRPALSSGLKGPAGVYHNTIYGNTSTNNGNSKPGGGAGVGMFAPGPGNAVYGNAVINNTLTNNTLTNNGHPGVSMHNHAAVNPGPAVNLNDNIIVGNVIAGNGADDGDASTPGPTGINIFSHVPVTGTIIAQNSIRNEQIGMGVNAPSTDLQAHLNNLQGSTGVDNLGGGTVDATMNYWGCPAGPGQNTCAGIIGVVVTSMASISPF